MTTKIKTLTRAKSASRLCLFITIENRSATGSRILDPIWDLEVGGVTEDGLDASESVQDVGDRDGNGMREGVLISNPLPGQTGLHLLGSEEQEAGIGTTVIKRISYI
jgi:hypothetical protein